MRLVVMGTGPFAVPMFCSLLESSHKIVALVTRPVPPARDRQKASPNPMRDVADQRSLPTFSPESVNSPESQAILADWGVDLFVVCDYGQILNRAVLGLSRLGGINLHGSLLPKYRGAAPINWALYHGEIETGVTVIHMTPKLDGGPRLAWRKTPIGPNETTPELESRMAELGIELVHLSLQLLDRWDGRSTIGELQDVAAATRAPRLKKDDGLVDWKRPATAIFNQVRALKPWPSTFTFIHGSAKQPMRLILDQVHVVDQMSADAAVPGKVVNCDGKNLLVATGSGTLSIDRVQPAGKRVMTTNEFLNGYPLRAGDQFGTRPT